MINITHQVFFSAVLLLCLVSEGAPYAGHEADDVQIISADLGQNLTIPCGGFTARSSGSSSFSSSFNEGVGNSVIWIHEGRGSLTNHVQKDGSIFFHQLQLSDAGVYSCSLEQEEDDDQPSMVDDNESSSSSSSSLHKSSQKTEWPSPEARFHIRVRTPPQLLKNVSVQPYTILARVMWDVDEKNGSGGYPIQNFQISYRMKNVTGDTEPDTPQWPLIHISPERRQYEIFPLHPNFTYLIQIWATNKLGKGPSTTVECSTHSNPQEIELGKHFLDGVDTFDVRIWIIAVAIVISTLLILGVATCCLFYKEYAVNLATQAAAAAAAHRDLDGEHIELMPNIILNPGYDFHPLDLQQDLPDENSNDTTAPHRLNNNSVIYPVRV